MAFRNSAIVRESYGEATMSRRSFNLTIGLLLMAGFGVLALTSWLALQPAVASLIAGRTMVLGGVGIVASIVALIAMFAGGRSHSTTLMAVGYGLFVLAFGASTSMILPAYNIGAITEAFVATAGISAVFSVLGIAFPRFFERIIGAVFAIFIGVVLASVIMLFMGMSPAWIDYVTVAIFAIFIGYDVHLSTIVEPNLFNALLVATNIFVDIVNVFMELVRIFSRD